MTVPMRTPPAGDIMEQVLIKGDIAKLTPDERVRYYGEVCRSMGLNPLTTPFAFIMLNGKLQLYALRSCTDQLRKINGVSLDIVSREVAEGILTIHVRARLPDGRSDEDLGAVAFPDTLKGEARANAELKAVTKAKRRATLSICGLGWLDETEIEDIPASAKRPGPPAPNVMLPPHDRATGEVIEDTSHVPATEPAASSPSRAPDEAAGLLSSENLAAHDEYLTKAAEKGVDALKAAWATLTPTAQSTLKAALDRRHKPNALAADQKRQALAETERT
jgi:hypothetical protein